MYVRRAAAGGFSLELGLKDVALVRACAGESGVPMPLASLLHDRFLAAQRRGRGSEALTHP